MMYTAVKQVSDREIPADGCEKESVSAGERLLQSNHSSWGEGSLGKARIPCMNHWRYVKRDGHVYVCICTVHVVECSSRTPMARSLPLDLRSPWASLTDQLGEERAGCYLVPVRGQ